MQGLEKAQDLALGLWSREHQCYLMLCCKTGAASWRVHAREKIGKRKRGDVKWNKKQYKNIHTYYKSSIKSIWQLSHTLLFSISQLPFPEKHSCIPTALWHTQKQVQYIHFCAPCFLQLTLWFKNISYHHVSSALLFVSWIYHNFFTHLLLVDI